MGQLTLDANSDHHRIHLISIIGEIEGHDNLGSSSKTTKYEHVLPQLAAVEDSEEINGVLILLNTMGGDVEAGLAIAEMITSLSKPTVSNDNSGSRTSEKNIYYPTGKQSGGSVTGRYFQCGTGRICGNHGRVRKR